MADPLGVRLLHRQANVAAKTLVRDQARRKLARVQTDVHLRIPFVKETHEAHLQSVVRHGRVAVFRHHKIDSHHARIQRSSLKGEQRLRKHLLLRKSAQHLIEVANLHPTRRSFIRLAPALALSPHDFRSIEAPASHGDIVAQSVRQQSVAHLGEIVVPAEFARNRGGVTEVGGFHQLEVLLVLCRRACGNFIEPLALVAGIGAAESREGIEEVVMASHAG